jgi:hypothetical protein
MGILEQLAEIKGEEVRSEVQEKSVRAFLANTEYSVAKIASFLGVTEAFVRRINASMRRK